MPDVPQVLCSQSDFSGGHWGAVGAEAAKATQWGGRNLMLSRQGGLVPCSASRPFSFTEGNEPAPGKVWGCYWAFGVDGLIYFVQQGVENDDDAVFTVRRFEPDVLGTPAVEDVDTITGPVVAMPDWTAIAETIFVTIYADKTYEIDPSGPALTALTGSLGDAPGGRAVCIYGERMLVGGTNDARFDNDHPNRIVYSDTDPADPLLHNWPDLNFFDVGGDVQTFIVGLYPMRDYLIIMFEDEQMWLLTGLPGVGTLRRIYGYHRGSGALECFRADHAAVDPSQSRLWGFGHASRGPWRFNGARVVRVPGFGVPNGDRTGTGRVEGALTPIGGDDELLVDRVALPRTDGDPALSEHVELVRVGGVWLLVGNEVIASRAGSVAL